ncbi:hypothetical protein N7448_011054 [Penicillium atrosanguineum]|nr:hypothetical protein N7448_011054 [Penicillium atrosanguineum]
MSKLFVVFGATGQQGGSLIHYILNRPTFSKEFRLRGITRDVSKPAALELQARGVEVREAIWDAQNNKSAAVEIVQGKAVADASHAARVALLIRSSLPSVTQISNGAITTEHHFDSKAEVEAYIRGLPFPSSVFFLPGWFMQNVHNALVPRPKVFTADLHLPLIDITDIGAYLAPALQNPTKYNGSRLYAATAYYTTKEMVDAWSAVSGWKVRFATDDEVEGFVAHPAQRGFLRAGELLRRLGYFGPEGPGSVAWMGKQVGDVGEGLTSWSAFLEREGPWLQSLRGHLAMAVAALSPAMRQLRYQGTPQETAAKRRDSSEVQAPLRSARDQYSILALTIVEAKTCTPINRSVM